MLNFTLRVALALSFFVSPVAAAHFPFVIAADDGSTARIIFSETLSPDDEVDVALLRAATLSVLDAHGKSTPIALPADATNGQWLTLALPGTGARCVHGEVDLGVMQRGTGPAHRLVYFPKAIVGDAFNPSLSLDQRVPIELVPERSPEGVRLRLVIAGQPAAATEIRVLSPDGQESKETTDANGRTRVLDQSGRYGAWARSWADEAGTTGGKSYEQVRRYATIVFDSASADAASNEHARPVASGGAALAVVAEGPSLPRAIASFGAVICDGAIYVYGGHSGERHSYSTATVSGRFSRLRLGDEGAPAQWEELPGGPQVQGLNLVAHAGSVIRVGGMEPRNTEDQPADNHSIAEVARFNTLEGVWSTLPALPQPRSSHDVVVVGDTLIVVGGWNLAGAGSTTVWPRETLLLDLSNKDAAWESLPQPFARRALTATVVGHSIYVIGGFDEYDRPQRTVDILDLDTRTWRTGPEIPGSARNGFAPAACAVDERVYVSVATGELFRLSVDGDTWELFAQATPRIVHRLVAQPASRDGSTPAAILVLGGAREAEMSDLVEVVRVDGSAAAPLDGMVSAEDNLAIRRPHANKRRTNTRVDAMVAMDEIVDKLRQHDRSAWASGSPDLQHAQNEAERLVTLIAQVTDDGIADSDTARFKELQQSSEAEARQLVSVLADAKSSAADRSTRLAALRATCVACHRAYRD